MVIKAPGSKALDELPVGSIDKGRLLINKRDTDAARALVQSIVRPILPKEGPVSDVAKPLQDAESFRKAVLPAGDYTFTVDSTALPATVTVHSVRESKTAPMIMAQAISQHGASGQSSLIIARNSGKGVVRGLQLVELGLDFEYASREACS